MKLPPLIFESVFKFFLFVILEVVAVLLIINNSIVQKYRIVEGVRVVQYFFWENSNAVKTYTNLRSINSQLFQENKILLEKVESYKNIIAQKCGTETLDSLSTILSGDYEFIPARVIKNTRNTMHNYLILDKGHRDGVTEDLGVITPSGVVGIIRAVGPNYSYVYSFLNERQSISAKIGESEAYGTLRWDGMNATEANLTEIPLNVDVKQGDSVYTSGNSSFFPSDIPVGTAISFTTDNGTLKNVRVRLLQDFKNLENVVIVKNAAKAEIDSLSAILPTTNLR